LKRRFQRYLSIFIILFIIAIPSISQKSNKDSITNPKNNISEENVIHFTKDSMNSLKSPSISNLEFYSGKNVSSFRILENIQSISEKTSINIDNEDFFVEIPENWNYSSSDLFLNYTYKQWQVLNDQNITNPLDWNFSTNAPKTLDPKVFYMEADTVSKCEKKIGHK